MKHTDTLVIGAGQAGLAMSHCLGARGVDHVVVERGRVAERWRSERWDSLRLLTPRWMTRLPGYRYRGPDLEGFMDMAEVVRFFDGYARSFDAPVLEQTTVLSVRRDGEGYRVQTDQGAWRSRTVVLATGYACTPFVPPMARALSGRVRSLVPTRYRAPDQLPPGGVLVVGASASGIQLADELARAGRSVVLSVGKHTRIPRRYRGRDILAWLDAMGVLDESAEEVHDLEASRAQPSLQLVGRPDHRDLDLATLAERGVLLVGQTVGVEGERVAFADDLGRTTAAADGKRAGLLARVDDHIERMELDGLVPGPDRRSRESFVVEGATSELHLRAAGIGTVLWATGFRRRYPWLQVPVLDGRGELRHRGGVTASPGLYAMGLSFMRRRKSSFIDGVGDDARDLTDHLVARLDGRPSMAA